MPIHRPALVSSSPPPVFQDAACHPEELAGTSWGVLSLPRYLCPSRKYAACKASTDVFTGNSLHSSHSGGVGERRPCPHVLVPCTGQGGHKICGYQSTQFLLRLFQSIWVGRHLAGEGLGEVLPKMQAACLSQDSPVTPEEFPKRLTPQALWKPVELATLGLGV